MGWTVIGFDVDAGRVDRLVSGESYVEDIADDHLASVVLDGRFTATSNPSELVGFDYAIITVPTPLRDGVPDPSYIEAAARLVGPCVRKGSTVVLESTSYPGTTDEMVRPILEETSGLVAGTDFFLGYSPERIDPGNKVWTLESTPKLVSGINEASLAATERFYGSIVEETVAVSGTREAELAKLLENTFRHVNVALVNELAMFARELGVDIWEAIDAASTKPFGFLRFTPGPGVGGHCLPVDPSYLSWRVKRSLGATFRFVELANDVNDHMPDYVVRRVANGLNQLGKPVSASRIMILGVAYKPNTGDARESPALRVIELLAELGADLSYVDPHVVEMRDLPGRRVELTAAALQEADAVVLLTDHEDTDYALVTEHARYVFDARRRLRGAAVEYL